MRRDDSPEPARRRTSPRCSTASVDQVRAHARPRRRGDEMSGFRAFILRGNLVELAVAFIMGTAFATVVGAFSAMLMGFVGKIGGQPDFGKAEIVGVNVGRFINALIAFLILAAVLYFFV